MTDRIKSALSKFRAILVCGMICCLVFTVSAAQAYGDTVQVGGKKVSKPDITAGAAALYCVNTDNTIYSKDANTRYLPFSITKLLTALIAVENLPMDQKVTVSKEAAEQEGSTMSLQEGEVVTVEELLYGTLMLSGNDAAYALAETCAGSEKKFVAMMNDRAREIGCTDTHFINPNGLTDDVTKHYTTANDFVKITEVCMKNPTVRKIAGTKKYRMPATNERESELFKTHLPLLTEKNSGIVAGKTGFWETGQATVSVLYDKNGLEMIMVLLGDTEEDRPDDMAILCKYGRQTVKGFRVAAKGDSLGKKWIRGGKITRVPVKAAKSVYGYPSDGKESSVKTKFVKKTGVTSPLKKGETVGTLKVYADGKLATSTPVVTTQKVEKGWFTSNLYISNAVAAIIVILILLFLVLRYYFRTVARRKRQKRRRARR